VITLLTVAGGFLIFLGVFLVVKNR